MSTLGGRTPQIRAETADDIDAIRALHVAAFGGSTEADIVDRLRASGALRCSLVASIGRELVGHLALSPVTITDAETRIHALGLGPISVTPAYQRRGIGTALIDHWRSRLADARDNLVVVVGHAGYYPRFGFRPARAFGIDCEYDVPDDVFLVLELRPGALAGARGLCRYDAAFAGAE